VSQWHESAGRPGHGTDELQPEPQVDLVDDTFLACVPAAVARVVADPARWAAWWPDLRLTTTRDRGLKGRQWTVQGSLVGTAEIWLEPWWDGVLLHHYLRADRADRASRAGAADGVAAARWAVRERQRRARWWKSQVHRLKDELETGRRPGEPSTGAAVESAAVESAQAMRGEPGRGR
jgi:hypothetical protein